MKLVPTQRLERHFKSYAEYHRSFANRVTHYIGIPAIMITLLGLLGHVPVGPSNAGVFLVVAACCYYLYLDWKLAIPFSLVVVGSYLVGISLGVGLAWSIFIAGWVLQFIGHYVFERKSPAFFDNLLQLLVGPLWVFAKWIGYGKP